MATKIPTLQELSPDPSPTPLRKTQAKRAPRLTRLQASLRQRAQSEGERWATELRSQMRKELRRAAGGWPGTISEARARVSAFVLPGVSLSKPISVTAADREDTARWLYRSARALWVQYQEREEDASVG